MNTNLNYTNVASWAFAFILLLTGILNLVLVHWVPGILYILLSLIYFLPGGQYPKFVGLIPGYAKILLAIIVIFFTLGVSDLGDMIDKLFL